MGAECLSDGSFTLVEGIISPFSAESLIDDQFTLSYGNMVPFIGTFWGCSTINGEPCGNIATYYKMIARDPDCTSLSYVSWVVLNQPDIDGSMYTGPRCGTSSLQDIAIEAKWIIQL